LYTSLSDSMSRLCAVNIESLAFHFSVCHFYVDFFLSMFASLCGCFGIFVCVFVCLFVHSLGRSRVIYHVISEFLSAVK
jgi:phosphoglycerol transferase MdoB-like AlkP superfamily enzyme